MTFFMYTKRIHLISLILLTGLSCIFSISCSRSSLDGKLIITQTMGNPAGLNRVTGESWRYVQAARIVVIDPGKPSSTNVLSEGFYSACSPEISPDGKFMLFAAQRKQEENWQIWIMDLENLKSSQVTSFTENCTDPVFLPNGRAVFSKNTANDTVKTGHSLYSCNTDGTDIRQLTFHPHANFATTVLHDGRLLTITRQLLPGLADPMFMVLRPDGTKADMFYKGARGAALLSRAKETNDGRILFIETDSSSDAKGNVVSISYNRPLHSRMNLTDRIPGSFNAVLPMPSGKYLVSYRAVDSENYALYEFDPANKVLEKKVYGNPDGNILDVILVKESTNPKKLPSEVDKGVKTGLLLCQDIHVTRMSMADHSTVFPQGGMIEIIGVDSTLGIVQVEEDGSFYLKVLADTPFQIRTLDENGNVVNGPCDWLWLRPNERRGCVGCHEDPELVPENNTPMAIKKSPVIIPIHLSEIIEKAVELE
jgi:hypothetical protein